MASQSYPPLVPPRSSVVNTLKELFPNVDSCVIEMVVDQFKELDPSINSLLSMSCEESPPYQPILSPIAPPSPFKKAASVILRPEEGIDISTISRLSPEAPEFIPSYLYSAPSSSYAGATRSRAPKYETYEVPPRLRSKLSPSRQSTEYPLPDGVISDLQAGLLVMVVLRGLPGSGKTRLGRRLVSAAGKGVVLSSDDFFLRNGKYEWKLEDLPKAHVFNQNRSKREVDQQTKLIIIDNTNLTSWEIRPYVEMAVRNGYRVFLVEPSTPWKYKPRELAKKNKHDVGLQKIRIMLDKYEKGLEIADLLEKWNLPLDYQRRLIENRVPPPGEPITQSIATDDVLNDEDIFESESEEELLYNDEEIGDIDYSMEKLSIDFNDQLTVASGESFDQGHVQQNDEESNCASTIAFSSNLQKYNIKPPDGDCIIKTEEQILSSDSENVEWEHQEGLPCNNDRITFKEDSLSLEQKPQRNLPGIKPISPLTLPPFACDNLPPSDVFLPNSDILIQSTFTENSDSLFAGSAFIDSKNTSQQEDAVGWEAMDKTVSWEPVDKIETPLEPRDQRRGRSTRCNLPSSPRSSSTSTAKSSQSTASTELSQKTESSLESLLTMFPNVPVCELENIHKEHMGDNSKVINFLLDKGESSSYQKDALDQENETIIDTNKGPTVTTVSMQLDPMFAVTLQEMFGPPLDQPFLEMLSPDEILSLPMPVNVAMQVFLAWRNALQNTLRSKPDIASPPEVNSPSAHTPPGFTVPMSPSQSRFPVTEYSSSPKTVLAPSARQFYEQQQLNQAMAASLEPMKKITKTVENVEQSDEEDLTQEQMDEYRRQRNELYKKAQDAHSRKAGGTAGFYARQAREMNEQIKNSQREMQMNWFINSNQDKSDSTLDLHYLPVKDAIENLKEFIAQQQAIATKNVSKNGNNRNGNIKTVEVVTGKGNRNELGKSKLKPAVINWLIQKNLKYSEINPGSLKVYINGHKM